MKTLLLTAAFALVVAATATAALADDAKATAKTDLDRFQGKWTTKAGPDKNADVAITIAGKAVTVTFASPDGQSIELKGELALDESAKPHKSIEWTKFANPMGEDLPDNHGIYAFEDDDAVKVCNGGPGNDRPAEFKAGEGAGPQLFVMKRAAEKKAGDKEEVKGDLAKLQGAWTALVGPEKNIPATITFTGSSVAVEFASPDGQSRAMKGKATLDESAKPHKALTLSGFTRPDGTAAPENLGIYAFDGKDTLKLCNGGPGKDRPTEFKDGENGGPNLIVLTRKAAEKK